MTDLPIPLTTKTVSTKVAPEAWVRAKDLQDRLGGRMSDIVSICLLYMDEEQIKAKLTEQAEAIGKLPKSVRGVLRNADQLDEAQRKIIIDALSGPL